MITEERFLRDVAKHKMAILLDDGIYRNVVFKNPADSCFWFGLNTWPQCLCFYGDMGTFVFQRLEDMFKFFRSGVDGEPINIKTGYWAEKINATDWRTGHEEFSEENFRAKVNEEVNGFLNDIEDDHFGSIAKKKEFIDALREEVEHEIFFTLDDEGKDAAISAAHMFIFERDGLKFDMADFYEYNFNEYTTRFMWACYAIQWGIRKYDLEKKGGAN